MSKKQTQLVLCDRCRGKGWIYNHRDGHAITTGTVVCPVCNGLGKHKVTGYKPVKK